MNRKPKATGAFRTISEVAGELRLPQHVLRFWETKFSQLKPMQRGGRRRYYRPEDVALLRCIQNLLYDDGYTIKGVQKLLRQGSVNKEKVDTSETTSRAKLAVANLAGNEFNNKSAQQTISTVISDLESLRKMLHDA